MSTAYSLPTNLSPATVANTASLIRIVALALISGAAIASRLFAVVNFESIIHELVLASKGFYHLQILKLVRSNSMVSSGSCRWRDCFLWPDAHQRRHLQPPARRWSPCGHTQYMRSSRFWVQRVRVEGATYLYGLLVIPRLLSDKVSRFTQEMKHPSAGLLAATFIGITPGYITRFVAGSYDNKAIAIFLLMLTFFCCIKALKQESALLGTIAAVFYFYMVVAWSGYAVITNMIPLHALVLVLVGRYSSRLYVAYCSWYAIGTLASIYIPIIASVSEHQPTARPSFSMDLQFLIFLIPAGMWLCYGELRDEHIFVIIYAIVASSFAGVMVRLMLTLTPAVRVASAIALSTLLDTFLDPTQPDALDADKTESESSLPVAVVSGTNGTAASTDTTTSTIARKATAAGEPTLTLSDQEGGPSTPSEGRLRA
ncbi:putative oligosaccharyl transferase STT3 subunit [Lyophyllum shimeji]|uniref:dolichyl-diphosphooligosaccharide--protein glycotransferase n=1 Tax=Lyophyllum shimeji TaxID=47721 RepID=A0A9P3UQM3_LYOSH|nr:putative oligosaccharyl transferase STT3 subunit [Lyophyllum shimeji]